MIQLRLLGAVGLETAAGPVAGRAAQKRRLALLALLALAPARTLSRDKLIALLWPESSAEHARHLLSVAIYELRKTLGEEALLSRGDDVQLGPAITTDLERIEAAVRAGEADTALGALGGPLMDGFHLSDSAEFERWLDQEREQWAQRCAVALEELAERRSALGDAVGAVEVWRRRAALDPYNGRVALALMRALDAAGDRAGALQHARVHTVMLREEFGTDPDPELLAFAEQLRSEPSIRARATPEAAGSQTRRRAAPGAAAAPVPVALDPATPDADPVLAGAAAVPASAPAGVHGAAGAPRQRRRFARLRARLISLQALTIAAILLSLGGIVTVMLDRAGRGPRLTAEEPVSIAVLPFRNLGDDETDGKFGDGLGVEVIHALTRAGLRVAPAGSAFKFRGDVDAPTAGAALNVGHILEGTYQRAGDELQVTAQLVSVERNRVLWTEQYPRRWARDEVLNLQEEIARAVVSALRVQLSPGEAERPLVSSTADERAWTEFTEGLDVLHRRTVPDLGQALAHFTRAVAYDSGFARAQAAVAEVHTLLGAYDYGVLPPGRAYSIARDAAGRALARDPRLAEAHAALASVNFNFDWKWAAAEQRFLEAVRLNRGFASAWQWYSLLLSARGRHEEAIGAARTARELDPSSLIMRVALARSHYYARDYDRSVAGYAAAIERDPSFLTAHLGLGLAYVVSGRVEEAIRHYQMARRLPGGQAPVVSGLLGHAHGLAGNPDEARAELRRLEQLGGQTYVPAEYRVLIHLGLGELDAALDALDDAFRNRSNGIAYLAADPILDPLRDQPRFDALMRRAGVLPLDAGAAPGSTAR